ncbi:hypothetical protein LIER_30176 [Lithospermum erythrorhizon]|uniref:F-box domain-containing protein n=1 Tax=Lithospermum erythrorhizon TaxID=34254 RepID=A0AAV3RLV5_LITER
MRMSQPNFVCDLPADVITEILCRLPIKTIVQCKCVCKNWQSLLLDSEFAKLHLSRSPSSIIINHLHSSVPDDNDIFSIIDLEHGYLCFDPVMKFDYTSINTEVFLLGSSNGLLLLNSIYDDSLLICNPIMREYISLPRAEGVPRHFNRVAAYGFGYCSSNGMYKVVKIDQEQSIDSETWAVTRCSVYSPGERGWRSVECLGLWFASGSVGVQLADKLHWFIFDPKGRDLICSFDLNRESFQPLPPPPTLSTNTVATLGVIRECLCLSNTTPDYVLELWVMKEYGAKESWTKELVINRPDYWLPYVLIYPITVLRDGEILFLCSNHTLFSAHHEKKMIKVFDDDIFQNDFEAMVHVPSFLSLNNFEVEVKTF